MFFDQPTFDEAAAAEMVACEAIAAVLYSLNLHALTVSLVLALGLRFALVADWLPLEQSAGGWQGNAGPSHDRRWDRRRKERTVGGQTGDRPVTGKSVSVVRNSHACCGPPGDKHVGWPDDWLLPSRKCFCFPVHDVKTFPPHSQQFNKD